jgi:hypothetical protein
MPIWKKTQTLLNLTVLAILKKPCAVHETGINQSCFIVVSNLLTAFCSTKFSPFYLAHFILSIASATSFTRFELRSSRTHHHHIDQLCHIATFLNQLYLFLNITLQSNIFTVELSFTNKLQKMQCLALN